MRNSTTLKSVLNRQYVTLGFGRPLESGLFDCRHEGQVGTVSPTISFKPFERTYSLPAGGRELSLKVS